MNLRDKQGNRAPQACRASQQGFTLVEMAIVLVIIGLIIGGILKGQEIINNARVKSQVAQIDSVKAAVATFADKFGYYPGDDPNTASQLGIDATFVGNGDGVVSTAAGTPDADSLATAVSTEPNMVWYEMQVANLISGVLSSTPNGNQTAALSFNYPGKIAGSFLTYADFSISTGKAGTPILNKMVRISSLANPSNPAPTMREQDASQIDIKYDDGLPYSGQIISASYANVACCAGNACTTAGSTYGLTAGGNASGPYCALLWITQ